jgi:hypothetical protein
MTFIGIDGRNNSLVPIRYSKPNQKLGEVFRPRSVGENPRRVERSRVVDSGGSRRV